MATTYEWNCKTVDTYPSHTDKQDPANTEADVVYNIHWSLTGTDDVNDIANSVYGTQSVSTDDLSTFIAFENLTTADVEGWVEGALEEEDGVSALEAKIDARIIEQITPTSVTKTIA
jgi:hypothetical protein